MSHRSCSCVRRAIMFSHKIASAMALLCVCIVATFAAAAEQPAERTPEAMRDQIWAVSGGRLKLRFNEELLALHGIAVHGAEPTPGQRSADEAFAVYPVRSGDSLQIGAHEGGFDRFVGGMLRVQGGFELALPGGQTLSFERMQLRAGRVDGAKLELVGADGRAWLYVDRLMYKRVDDPTGFYMRSADIRATPALAAKVGAPELADAYVGELKMLSHVASHPASFQPPSPDAVLACPDFHGTPHPGGGTFEADVLMESHSMSFIRCRTNGGANGCDGAGADNGEVVFAPGATLRNSNNPNTADVPWFEKFSTNSPYAYPYSGNDQHPYLIWNMYRIADDQLEQIGASGLKHAFLTINSGCTPCLPITDPLYGHVLSKNCGNTYGVASNDYSGDLGPRSELIPATGYWGRCGSIFDSDCDGIEDSPGGTSYGRRMIVRESQMQVPGAQYYSESWYIVQDDIDIYNTMGHRTMTPTPGASSGWTSGTQGPFLLGPLLNTWVSPVSFPTRNIEIASDEGHTRIAVKVKALASCPSGSGLSGTCHRYDYAVDNFDFGRAMTEGAPPNLRVLENRGFDSFTIPLDTDAIYLDTDAHFADIDTNVGNNWTAAIGSGQVTWTAPAGSELNWGLLFRFTVIGNEAPDSQRTGTVRLGVAGPGEPSEFSGDMMVPSLPPNEPNDVIFVDGFEVPA